MPTPNKLASIVTKVNNLVPSSLRSPLLSWIFASQIKLAGTAGIQIIQAEPAQTIAALKNRKKVQNHIGGVHAVAAALVAESATAVIMGLNVPDSHVPLVKSMKVDYVKRATGDLKAVAKLTSEQIHDLQTKDRGELTVDVVVTDSAGISPCNCEMIWAWTSKERKPKAVA